jgi:hypothetical protein
VSDPETRIAALESDLSAALRRVRELNAENSRLRDTLARALPFVEDAETDPAYMPGAVKAISRQVRAEIEGGTTP